MSLTPADLTQLPTSWVNDLRQAAMLGHIEPLLALINQLDPEHSKIGHALTAMTRDFQFAEIVALTEAEAK